MMIHNWSKGFFLLLAEFFYCGRFPFAPGTAGSLASLAIWVPLVYYGVSNTTIIAILVSLFFLGVWASSYGIAHYRCPDPKQVVIDEVVGQGLPFLVIGPGFLEIAAAFLLFRFFDILKPWPIKLIEREFPDHWGIMLDDVAAGIMAMMVIFIAQTISRLI